MVGRAVDTMVQSSAASSMTSTRPLNTTSVCRWPSSGPCFTTASEWMIAALLDQLVDRDRQVPHPLAGRVVDGVGDRRGDSRDADLADAPAAERVDHRIGIVQQLNFEMAEVGV